MRARTIRANLGRWSKTKGRLLIDKPVFFSRTRRHAERWQIVLLVDESGSMLSSVIHAAVTAACLWGLPGMRTHLCIFDTNVVDLTEQVTDPVETLMKVQLGGGTDIGKAVAYGAGLLESPRRSNRGAGHRLLRGRERRCPGGPREGALRSGAR